jgi:hypothetical protein
VTCSIGVVVLFGLTRNVETAAMKSYSLAAVEPKSPSTGRTPTRSPYSTTAENASPAIVAPASSRPRA